MKDANHLNTIIKEKISGGRLALNLLNYTAAITERIMKHFQRWGEEGGE